MIRELQRLCEEGERANRAIHRFFLWQLLSDVLIFAGVALILLVLFGA